MRLTRAKAAEVAENLHIAPDAVLELPSENGLLDSKPARTPEKADRAPLGNITPNSNGSKADKPQQEDEGTSGAISKRNWQADGGKKGGDTGAPGVDEPKTGDQAAETCLGEAELGLPTDRASATESTNTIALEADTTLSRTPLSNSATPPTAAMRLTMSQIGRTETSEGLQNKSLSNSVQSVTDQLASVTLQEGRSDEQSSTPSTKQKLTETPATDRRSALPKGVASLRKDTPSKRSVSNKENISPADGQSTPTVIGSHTAAGGALTSPAVARHASVVHEETKEAPLPVPQDPIEAMDALEEAVDRINAEVPKVELSPPKPKSKKAAPLVRATKASQARISLAQGDRSILSNAPSLGRPRQSTTLGRSGSVRSSTVGRPTPSSRAAPRHIGELDFTSDTRAKKEVEIPHSKPRPISLSFPTPPPPPKSTKPPTKSTFQLPGEAVAAKLKAQREERTKKEAEEERKKPGFKARPVPASLLKIAPTIRQTNASSFRQSLMTGDSKPAASSNRLLLKGKGSIRGKARPPTPPLPRSTDKAPAATSADKLAVPAPITVAKRSSILPPDSNNSTASQASFSDNTRAPPSADIPAKRISSKGTSKGKEIFNRAAQAKEAAEREKREKEEAAKKARVAAAERGRAASREWAEKQRAKKAGEQQAEHMLGVKQFGDSVMGAVVEGG